MGLHGDILDKIINFILPINEPRQQQSSAARPSDGQENFQRPFFHCTYVHPILRTCRELRYEYGQRFCKYQRPTPGPTSRLLSSLHQEVHSKAD